MGAARRLCVRAVVLTVLMSALLSLALPSCQFPDYGIESGVGGSAGLLEGGMPNFPAGAGGTSGDDPGGDGGAGASNAGAAGEQQSGPPCAAKNCVPAEPDWPGPIAFWEGMATSAVPDCPPGYANPIDRYREVIAPNPCPCTCAAQGQVCSTTLRIFPDMTCGNTPCATVSSVTSACKSVSGCTGSQGSLEADLATISGGSCQPMPTPIVPATWRYHARVCQPTGSCDDPGQVCAPTPPLPYVTQRCVTRLLSVGQTPPECPTDYPDPQALLYDSIADTRSCSLCGCGSVTGGSCSGQLVVHSLPSCPTGTGTSDITITYPLDGGGCSPPFNLGSGQVHPTSVIGEYMIVPGACSVTSPASPSGDAVPSGRATLVCCKK